MLLPLVRVWHRQPTVLKGNGAKGSPREELGIICPVGSWWDCGGGRDVEGAVCVGETERKECIVQTVSYPEKNLEHRGRKPTASWHVLFGQIRKKKFFLISCQHLKTKRFHIKLDFWLLRRVGGTGRPSHLSADSQSWVLGPSSPSFHSQSPVPRRWLSLHAYLWLWKEKTFLIFLSFIF